MKKVILPLIVLIVGVLLTALLILLKRPVEQVEIEVQPPLVRVMEVRSGEHRFRVHSQGTVEAKTSIPLMAEVDGVIVAVSPALADGGFFRKGEELVTLDPRDFELAVTQARARVAAAEVQQEIIQAEANVAEAEWSDLGGGRTPSELLLRKPQLEEASASLEGAIADLRRAELDLQRTHIVAPFDGRVREKDVDLGQLVRRADRIASIFSIDRVEVDLPLPLNELAYLDLPLEMTEVPEESLLPEVILTGNYAGKTHQWRGRIVRQDGEIDPVSRMTTMIVEVEDPYGLHPGGQTAPLKVGMFVEAEIIGQMMENAVVLPRTALRNSNEIWRVDADDTLDIIDVEVVRLGREECVIGSGLSDGDRVVLSPLETPIDGMALRVADEPQEGGAR